MQSARFKKDKGYIALMAVIIISFVLMGMAVEESSIGASARYSLLNVEAYEEARQLAKGCADHALLRRITDPSYTGGTTHEEADGTCRILPFSFDTPTSGNVTIRVQAQVRNVFCNSEAVYDLQTGKRISYREVRTLL